MPLKKQSKKWDGRITGFQNWGFVKLNNVSMFLKKLEISGFKSFDKKISFEFPKSICAIVGPNGSGKSNIVDAIRWALGEQSMKFLRSKKSEDLIFGGSEKKPRLSKASVFLYFDNQDFLAPIEFGEVSIGRKIYRTGENEYLINNSQVRLKDILELCAKARMGLRGYAIINQGMGDSILNASSFERKEMIEEAIGLKEFQIKKNEARQKLKAAKENLLRVNDLIKEIVPHLRFLKRQFNKLQKKEELEKTLEDLSRKYLYKELLYLLSNSKDLENKLRDLDSKISNYEKDFSILQEEIKTNLVSEDDISFQENELNKLEREKSKLERELGKIEGMIEVNKNTVVKIEGNISFKALVKHLKNIYLSLKNLENENSVENIKKHLKDLINFTEKIISEIENPKDDRGKKNDLIDKQEEISQLLNKYNREITNLKKNIQEKYNKNKENREKFFLLKEKIENLKFSIRDLKNEKFLILSKLNETKQKEDLLQRSYPVFNEIKELVKKELSSANFAPPQSLEEVENLKKEIEKIKIRLEFIYDADPEVQKEYDETQKRYEFLINQSEDIKKAIEQLNGIIKNLQEQIEEKFSSSFTDINKEFDKFFKLLFKGGNASLNYFKKPKNSNDLESEDMVSKKETNIDYEEGVEIKVSLPKKRIKGLTALSGGERALCSLALLFALVGATSPPFLVLDEIDAALDETNSQSFIKILKNLNDKTQFILITHNRATMQSADVLYGITMQDGASQVLSIDFEKAKNIINPQS